MLYVLKLIITVYNRRWFKYGREDLCVNKSQFFSVIFEPPCISLLLADTFTTRVR
jgi:hypothetical protein